jgi:hypothetical protein
MHVHDKEESLREHTAGCMTILYQLSELFPIVSHLKLELLSPFNS